MNSITESVISSIAILAYSAIYINEAFTSLCLTIVIVFFTAHGPYFTLYLLWMIMDSEICEKGGRPNKFFRTKNYFHDLLVKYFPITCHHKNNSFTLNPKRNYLFVVIPHGFHSSPFFIACSYNFFGLFPNHRCYGTTLNLALKLPIFREIIMATGIVSASERSLNYLLGNPNGGNIVGLCPGGAEEAFLLKKGTYKVIIKHRRGFARVALKNGSPLIPCISFGETDLYDQFTDERLKSFQTWIKKTLGFVPILPKGRGIFQPSFIPHKKPINIVFGKPIQVKKVSEPTQEQINSIHRKFVEELEKLFEMEKYKYLEDAQATKLEFV